jgi:hypothetical protein
VLLLLVIAGNIWLTQRIDVSPTDWSRFFPAHVEEQTAFPSWFDPDTQYLFIDCNESVVQQWQDEGIVRSYFALNREEPIYLLLFDRDRQNRLLEVSQGFDRGGTSVIGSALLESFFEELAFFLTYVVPCALVILLLATSFRYWTAILLETGLFLLLFESAIVAGGFTVDPPSLLAVIFLVIYAFTLFNYVHMGKISRQKLLFGITVSVMTTALSAAFLCVSDFGLIHAFGAMLLLGLGVLFVYMTVRLFGGHCAVFASEWTMRPSRTVHLRPLLLLAAVFFLFGIAEKELRVDLNPVNLIESSSSAYEKIVGFETRHLPALPFVVVFESSGEDFSRLPRARELAALSEHVASQSAARVLSDVNRAFSEFSPQPLAALEEEAPYAQFILANDMFATGMPLFSSDYKQAYMTLSVPVTSSSEALETMVHRIAALSEQADGIRVEVVGKVADFEYFIAVFLREFLVGMGCAMLFMALFFVYYCRTPKVLFVLLAALFSMTVLLVVHLLLALEITLLTLMTVILYSGLISDTLIHLFISYKQHAGDYLRPVLKPILLSNMMILAGLGGMMLSGSIMQHFALELIVLLGSNLFFVLCLMPSLLKRYL